MKIIVTFFCILILSFFPVSAESYNIDEDNSVRNSLDEKTGDFLDKNGIDIENDEWIKNITPENVFKHIGQFLKNGMKIPLKSGVSVLAIVLISAAISAIGEKGAYPAAIYATTIATSGILISPVYLCISAATSALRAAWLSCSTTNACSRSRTAPISTSRNLSSSSSTSAPTKSSWTNSRTRTEIPKRSSPSTVNMLCYTTEMIPGHSLGSFF